MRYLVLSLLLFFLSPVHTPAVQQPTQPDLTITVLAVGGTANYARVGWRQTQPMLTGALVGTGDFIYPQAQSLLVMCPDGVLTELSAELLLSNTVIQCPISNVNYLVGEIGERSLNITRGGTQSAFVPYLITPRATVVRNPQGVTLRWNALTDVLNYTLTLRGNGQQIWESEALDPADVTTGEVASIFADVMLQPGIPYTVEICLVFQDLRHGCTTDPGWSSGENTAFYYQPTPLLESLLNRIMNGNFATTPEGLYAQAVLLAQPVAGMSTREPIGIYHEAIDLLERIVRDYPTSALAGSPELHNLLGNLYRSSYLPRSANLAYAQARALAANCTEVAAIASLGQAMTTTAGDEAQLYNEALDHYFSFLLPQPFTERFETICTMIGDICSSINISSHSPDQCQSYTN